jgi:O-antigen/teichoic acid export membrane protein
MLQNNTFKQTVAKNSFWLLFWEFAARLFTFFISIRVARSLWVIDFGTYNFVMTFVTLFVLVVDFGLWSLTFRELSKNWNNSSKYFINVVFIKIVISVFVLIAAFIVSKLYLDSGLYLWLIIVFLLHSIIVNISEFLRVFFRPIEKMEKEAFLKILSGVVLFISTILFLQISASIQYVFYGFLTSSIINLIISLIYVKRHLKFQKNSIDLKFIKQILKMSIPFFLGWIFIYFYSDINVVLLKFLKWENYVWLFSAPYRLLSYIYIIFNVFSLAMFKKLVEASKDNFRFKRIINKFAKYNLLLSIFLSLFLMFFGKHILLIIYWVEYISSFGVLQILSIILIFKSISYVYWNWLTAMSKEYTRLYIQIFIAVINVSANLVLIPRFGILWAAYSLLISEVFLMFAYVFFTKRYINF